MKSELTAELRVRRTAGLHEYSNRESSLLVAQSRNRPDFENPNARISVTADATKNSWDDKLSNL
jgi:hypothetical protein